MGVHFRIKGQSFLLHQIRMIMGLVMCVMTGRLPVNVFSYIFLGPDQSPINKFKVPVAPSAGLFLYRCFFDDYDKRATQSTQIALKRMKRPPPKPSKRASSPSSPSSSSSSSSSAASAASAAAA